MTPEKQFERELEVFRTEVESASQFLFSYFAVHAVAQDHEAVHNLFNTAPLFWNTAIGALQSAGFIALGRIFDQNSAHNVDKVLGLAQRHLQIFSRSALGQRRQGMSASAPDWLDDFLKKTYEPSAEDFRRAAAAM